LHCPQQHLKGLSGDLLNPEFSGIGIQHIKIPIFFPDIAFQGIMKHLNIQTISVTE